MAANSRIIFLMNEITISLFCKILKYYTGPIIHMQLLASIRLVKRFRLQHEGI